MSGVLKSTPADFVVEEIPVYEPCGEGEHLFLWVEKEDVAADVLVRHLARTLEVKRDDIGVAGLKDKRAITRQQVSVPVFASERLEAANTEGIRVLSAKRHKNKLKTGHLKGNRFSILLRGSGTENGPNGLRPPLAVAEAIVNRLRELGIPNYYGEQRFGIGGETSALGYALLRGEKTVQDIPPAKRKFLLRLALSAAQSELFNLALAERMTRGELRTVLDGDVMRKTDTGGIFVVTDVSTEQSRLDAGEIQVTGPLFGPKMPQAQGEAGEREKALLNGANLPADAFERYSKLTAGTRRPYLISVPDLAVTEETEGLRFSFSLPAGAYATVLLREITKSMVM